MVRLSSPCRPCRHGRPDHPKRFFLLGQLGDQRFGGEQQAGDGRGVLQRGAGDLRRIDDAGLHEVFVFAGGDVVAFVALALLDFLHDEGAFLAGVVGQLAERASMARRTMCTPTASSPSSLRLSSAWRGARHAAAGDDAFFDGRAGRVQRVFDARLLFLHFGLGRGADIDDGHAAGQLGEAFLQFLAVVVGGGFLDLAADLVDAALDICWWTVAFDDRGVFLVDDDALGAAEVFERDVLKLDAEVFGDATCRR